MSAPNSPWTEGDTHRAWQIWSDYQKTHDLTERTRQAVGIDPGSGQVWFGTSARDIVVQLEAKGIREPLLFLRVGQDYYARKGGRR